MKFKSKIVQTLFVIAVLLSVSLVASPAMSAPDKALTIKSMKVSVWPEYDDSRILVTYQGEFSDAAYFPKQVNFPIPQGSEINQVCALKQPGDEHLCQLYNTSAGTTNINLSYTLPIPTYYLEYYWDGIQIQADKSFRFTFTSPYAVDKLDLEIQQPLKASEFKLDQKYVSVNSDNLGMKYYHYRFDNVTQGQEISVNASYIKPDNKPSVAKKQGSNSGASAGGSNPYAILGISAAVLVLFFLGYKLLKPKPASVPVRATQSRKAAIAEASKRTEARPSQQVPLKQSRNERIKATMNSHQTAGGLAFCSKCGVRLNSGDNFCPACGEKTRRPV